MLRRKGYRYDTIGKHARLKFPNEVFETGDEFPEGLKQEE
jgi:hypothetical protein